MGSSVLFLSFFPFIFLFHLSSYKVATGQNTCRSSTCGNSTLEIRFPFRIERKQEEICGYPGFDFKCDPIQSRTILELPSSGRFWVHKIDYMKQQISIVDPENCIWRRFLSLSLSGSVFSGAYYENYTILSCSTNLTMPLPPSIKPIDCMSNSSYKVLATPDTGMVTLFWTSSPMRCERIATVAVPVPWSGYHDKEGDSLFSDEDLVLKWDKPNCVDCEKNGGNCGRLKSSNVSNLEVGCFDHPPTTTGNTGLPRSLSYAVIIGIGIPALLCGIGLACYVGGKVKSFRRRNSHIAEAGSSSTVNPHTAVILIGLGESTIESYPKVVLGESCRLPGNNDSPCPICLAEYQPNETLRTIPQCQHCFHDACIDEWLRTNATCPLCRTSPAPLFCVHSPP